MATWVQELDVRRRRRSYRALLLSTVTYLLVASAAVFLGLVWEVDVVFPTMRSPLASHMRFLAVLMFPAVSVLALIVGWAYHSAGQFNSARIAALLPWLFGFFVLAFLLSGGQ